MHDQKQGFKVLAAATGINLVSGTLYIWGIISKFLTEQLHWTSKQASLPYTLATVSFVLAMVLFGSYQDQQGPRKTATIGSIFLGVGIFLSGILLHPIALIVTMGMIAGTGMGILNVSTTPPAVKWFPPQKKGMVTGIVVAGVSLSSLLYAPLANQISQTFGIAKVFIVIGAIALMVTTTLAQLLKNPPENPGKAMVPIDGFSHREMLQSPNFYVAWIMLALSSSAGLMVIGHIAVIAKIQANWQSGFLLVMLLAVFNAIGRFAGGSLSDKIGRTNLMRIIFLLQSINMFLFIRYTNFHFLLIGTAVAGMCYGATFSVFPATISDLYGLKYFGMNYGLMFTGWGMGGIIGPMTGAALFDATGSYAYAYRLASILLFMAFSLTFLLDRLKKPSNAKRP